MLRNKKLEIRIEILEKKVAELELQLQERQTVINNYSITPKTEN